MIDALAVSSGTASVFSAKRHANCPRTHSELENSRNPARHAPNEAIWQEELVAFPDYTAQRSPGQEIHVVLDNYATHKTEKVRQWLADHPS